MTPEAPPLQSPPVADVLLNRPGEACGVFGIHAPGADVARLAYFGLFALQHRGQESAGIAVSDTETMTVYKDLGLVAQVFDEATLAGLRGDIAIGHTRYSTTGSSVWANAQPTYRQVGQNGIALAHNGNLTNTRDLADRVGKLFATTDSELMTEAIAQDMHKNEANLVEALTAVLPTFEGAFTLAVMDRTSLVGVRDRHGFRPLSIGKLGDGWVLASESAAFDIMGATFFRDVEPGEMVVIDDRGITSVQPFEP
ncbi:MAG: class II glutamine amidotransferase, partial [Acidimicrobiia bacterium]|nr:class II glutamine amidotransferase [Acidimicrobiia bacterium]